MINGIQSFFQLSFFIPIILFSSCESTVSVSPWDVVDTNSVFIVESKETPRLPDKKFAHFFLNKDEVYLSSIQQSSKNNFDILYSYLLNKDSYDSLLTSKSQFLNQKITSRILNGIEIYEVSGEGNEIQLVFTYLGGVFVLSKSSLLIENAIRVFQNKEKRGFKRNNTEIFQFPSLKSDRGNIYVNLNNLSEASFTEFSLFNSIPLLSELRSLSVYDVKSDNGFLSLNGFSLAKNSSLSLFQKQRPVTFKLARYIPNYSNLLVHLGISDFPSFIKEINDSSFLKTFDLGSEIAFIANDNSGSGLCAFIEYKQSSSQIFDFITTYSEVYSNYHIQSVNGELLKKRFGKIFPNAPFSFCTTKDNYLILSQSVDEMKSLIDAIENDDTWGKTSDYQKFSEQGLQESNVTFIFKKPDLFSGKDEVLKGYSALIDSIGLSKVNWLSVQISALDNHFYSTVNFSLGSMSLKSTGIKQNSNSSFIELPGTARFASLVKNYITELQEVLIQDSDLMVYLISLKDGIIWKRQIDSQIKGPLVQLDFYKNGKFQYFFSSEKKLYVIDRLGREVAGFPKPLPSGTQFSSLVDYDKSKNYRFLISSIDNEVYLFDKEGNNIKEWGPKRFEKQIACSPEHIKVGGKDHFIIFLTEGTVHVFNRRGERVYLLEIKNKEIFSGDFYLESGVSSSSTYLHYALKDGTITKQDLSGKIISTENLLRGKNSKFVLKRINNRDGFYVYRTDTDKIVVFDEKGEILFEQQNSGSVNLEFQCFVYGNNQKVFGFFDLEQRLVHVFDQSGNQLIQTPVESDVAPLFSFDKSKNELGVYTFSENLTVYTIIK